MFIHKIRKSKLTSIMLVFLLIFQTVIGIFIPVTVFFDSHYIQNVETVKAYGENWYELGGTWDYRKQIVIDHTKVANTDQIDFPVVLSFTDDMLKNISNGGHVSQLEGEDILFTSSEGSAKLAHEIEYYDNITGEMVVWVKVPILSASEDTILYMYYGNDSCANQEDATNVWDDDYVMVQHMDDTTTSTVSDSTSYNNDGIKKAANESLETVGKIGRAQSFDGSDYIRIADDESLDVADELTLDLWVNTNLCSDQKLAGKSTASTGYVLAYWCMFYSEVWPLPLGSGRQTAQGGYDYNGDTVGNWVNMTLTWKKDGQHNGYINGQVIRSFSAGSNSLGINNNSFIIGAAPWNVNGFPTNGLIDEVRLSKIERSEDWILTGYNNQNDPNRFSFVKSEESLNPIDLSDWKYRKAININHTKVNGSQTNFPILIDIQEDEDLSLYAENDGYDIIFVPAETSWSDGDESTRFFHEIESYDAATGKLLAWVNVDNISSSDNTVIYMYFGNSAINQGRDRVGLWDSDYKMIQHMGDYTSLSTSDSSSNFNNTLKKAENEPVEVMGIVGAAQSFDGLDDNLSVLDNSSIDLGEAFTLEAWAKGTGVGSWTKKKNLTVSSDSTNVIPITVDYESEMKSDFSDLRFVNQTGDFLIYQIQSYSSDVDANILLEFDHVPHSEMIYMYYGNPSALSVDTEVEDNFESTAWSIRDDHILLSFNDKAWIVGGYMESGNLSDIWSSDNAIDWIEETSDAGWPVRAGHESFVFNDKIWIMGGYDDIFNDVWSSSDGINWTQETAAAPWSGRYYSSSVVFDGKMWILGGRSSSSFLNDVWSSSDGINWTEETAAAPWSARMGHSALVFDGKMWIMGGYYYSSDVWSSSDGINWTQETAAAPWSGRYRFNSMVYNDKIWIMGGRGIGSTFKNDVWSSSDGINWTQETAAAPWSTRYCSTGGVFDDKMWVMGGFSSTDSADVNDLWSSVDGVNWVHESAGETSTVFGEETDLSGGLGIILGKGTNYNLVANDSDLPLNTWTYLTLTNDGTTQKYYINGELISSQTKTIPTVNSDSLKIGDGYFSIPFAGVIDEVRISNTARSNDWIKTNYNTQSSPSSFYSLSLRETYGVNVPSDLHFDTNYGDKIIAMWDGGDNDPITEYYIENITTGENSGWVIGLNTYIFENLNCDTYYTFRVKSRFNSLETIYNTETVSTAHCGPVIFPVNNQNQNQSEENQEQEEEQNNNEESEEENESNENTENNNETNNEINNDSNNNEKEQDGATFNKETVVETTTPVVTQYLSFGNEGEQVRSLQIYLKQLNFFPQDIEPNGNFGSTTLQAVKEFQKSNGINPTGYVGPVTLKALNNQPILSNPDYEYERDLKYNDRGEDVVELQDNLKERAFFPKRVNSTGWFGPITQGAVNWFKDVYGLVQDGVVDEAMREMLGDAN